MVRPIVVLAIVASLAGAAQAWVQKVTAVTPSEAARQITRAQGRVRVVLLYSATCPHCRRMFPEFVELAERYRSQGVQILTFATDDDPALVEEFLGDKRLPFPTARIERQQPGELDEAMRPTGIELGTRFGVPFVAVLDRDGTVVGQSTGSGGARRIEAWLDEIGVEAP